MVTASNGRRSSSESIRSQASAVMDPDETPLSIREGRDLGILVPKQETVPSLPFRIKIRRKSTLDESLGSQSPPCATLSRRHSEENTSSSERNLSRNSSDERSMSVSHRENKSSNKNDDKQNNSTKI